MTLQSTPKITPFLTFNRQQWAELRKSMPLTLTEEKLKPLLGFNEDLSLEEVSTIYLPLARLINYYIEENLKRQSVLNKFLGVSHTKVPYIISVAGSVSVGKSTSARILQALLSQEHKVELITTDGFLYPLAVLEKKQLLKKKGFPESYDIHRLINFVSDLKSGKNQVKAPVYSHLTYDIIPDQFSVVNQADIVILEGLNVLQSGMNYPSSPHNVFVSDFVDFSIYVDADEQLLKQWYIHRFLKFRRSAFSDPNAYFHHYSTLSEEEAIQTASTIWDEINGLNLRQNILPSRERANLILVKGDAHAVETVKLRK
ncbi:pantothenate kinase [Nicoletella semolina]|uniref:Pantothenate kinase n=1 Tax=Nicoletella semolina TaxID=271160 RepID=A0A4R2N576_9PAST|nr:type I pantothenate kinase [Nicoletella semolina]MDH2924776.1 type I pantothenate kinase [Nicoletella semolina]TCP15993.1 pantothenate kinase [Nicoletella semolina]